MPRRFAPHFLALADATRRWRGSQITNGWEVALRLKGEPLNLHGINQLLENVDDLRADFNPEVIWQLAHARGINQMEVQVALASGQPNEALFTRGWETVWLALLALVCIVTEEAKAYGLGEVVDSFASIPWWRSIPGVDNPSGLADNQTRSRWGAPKRAERFADCFVSRPSEHRFPPGGGDLTMSSPPPQ
jgi:hypothetical protein